MGDISHYDLGKDKSTGIIRVVPVPKKNPNQESMTLHNTVSESKVKERKKKESHFPTPRRSDRFPQIQGANLSYVVHNVQGHSTIINEQIVAGHPSGTGRIGP